MSGRSDESRDHPLSCHWRPIDPDAYEMLGLPPAKTRAEAVARSAVITEAFVVGRADPEAWISYSRRRQWYADSSRYWPTAFTYTTVVRTVDLLAAAGLFDHRKMPPLHFGWQSRFKASAELISLLNGRPVAVIHHPRELLILRDKDGDLVNYSDTVRTRRMRRDLEEINEALSSVEIGLREHGIINTGDPLRLDGLNIGAARNCLHRVFNRGSFSFGGRFYGPWWQNIPTELRQQITINDSRTVELDYPSLHPTFLFAQSGELLRGDPYKLPGRDRTLVKIAFNTLVNADTRLAAVRSIANEMGGPGAYRSAEALVREIEAKHISIAHTFGRGAGLRLMRLDSDLTESLMLRLIRKPGVVALPIHDSYIVPECHKGDLMEAMVRGMANALRLVARSAHKTRKIEDSDPQYGALGVPSDGSWCASGSVPSIVIIFPEHPQRDFFGGDRIEVPASDILGWRGGIAPVGVQQALRHEINRLGLRQHELAGLLRVSPSQLSNLQRGRYGASAELAERIRNFFIANAKTVGGGTLRT